MTRADHERFLATFGTLSVLPLFGRSIDELFVAVYWRVLRVLPWSAFEASVHRALATCRAFPTPAELLDLARDSDPATDAALAFEQVLRLHHYSPHAGATWSETEIRRDIGDAAAQAYRAAGGSPAMRHALWRDAHAPYTQKAFVECYQRVVHRDPTTALPSPRPERILSAESAVDAMVEGVATARRIPDPRDTAAHRAGVRAGFLGMARDAHGPH